MDLDIPEGNKNYKEIRAELAGAGMEYMSAHFMPLHNNH